MLAEAKERIINLLPKATRVGLASLGAAGLMAFESGIATPVAEAGGGCQAGIELGLPQEYTGRVPCPDEFVLSQVTKESNRPIILGALASTAAAILYLRRRRSSSSNS